MSKKLKKNRNRNKKSQSQNQTYKEIFLQFGKEKEAWNNRGKLIEQKCHYENEDLIKPTFILNQLNLYTESMYYLNDDAQYRQTIKHLIHSYWQNVANTNLDKKILEMQSSVITTLENFNKDIEDELVYGKKIKEFLKKLDNNVDIDIEDLKNQIRNIEQPKYMRTHLPVDILISGGYLNLKSWEKYRKIYRVDEIFVDYLQESMKDDSDLDVLQYIPYKSCAFQIRSSYNYLYVVTIDTDRKKGYVNCYAPSKVQGKLQQRISLYIELDLSLNYGDCIKQALTYSIGNPLDLYTSTSLWGVLKQGIESNLKTNTMRFYGALKQEKTGYGTFSFLSNQELANADLHNCISDPKLTRPVAPNQREMLEQLISIVLTMLYYVSAKGIEQSEKKYIYRGTEDITNEYQQRTQDAQSIQTTKTNQTNQTKEKPYKKDKNLFYVSEIGVQETDFLKRNKLNETNKNNTGTEDILLCKKNRYKYKPHVRKAHWHLYWVGKKNSAERHKELRFISPIIVNKDLGEVETIEIQKIQSET